MALTQFDVQTSRRLALALLAATGALLFKAIDLVGAAGIAGQVAYSEQIARSLIPLTIGFTTALFTFACVEIAAHPDTPTTGHPHSVPNYLQTAFALIVVSGLIFLAFGGVLLISGVAAVPRPS